MVGIVTMPFTFEGRHRQAQAREGLERLKSEVDTCIAIQNDRLLKIVPANTPLTDAFRVADMVLYHATKGISDLITVPGLVNLDFADVRSVMTGMGDAIMGAGVSKGDQRAHEAATAAISSPLLEEIDIRGAQGVLVNITGGRDMTLHEVSEATSIIQESVGADANLIFGAVIDPNGGEEMRVTVIATGFGERENGRRALAGGLEMRETPRPGPAPRPAAPPEPAPRPAARSAPAERPAAERNEAEPPRAMEAQAGGETRSRAPGEEIRSLGGGRRSMFEEQPAPRILHEEEDEERPARPSRERGDRGDLDIPTFIRRTMD